MKRPEILWNIQPPKSPEGGLRDAQNIFWLSVERSTIVEWDLMMKWKLNC
jgi:hypothetical protein